MRVFLYFLCLICIASCKNEKEEQKPLTNDDTKTTYYLIRHAEKDRSDSTKVNPDLTAKGFERAKHWASYFDSIPFEKVYATNYLRTSNTASYTAAAQTQDSSIASAECLYSFYRCTLRFGNLVQMHAWIRSIRFLSPIRFRFLANVRMLQKLQFLN